MAALSRFDCEALLLKKSQIPPRGFVSVPFKQIKILASHLAQSGGVRGGAGYVR